MDDSARLQHVLDVLTRLAAGMFGARVELSDQDDELSALALAVDDETVVRAVVGLATGLGLSVVAEGVETERQLDELVRLGCPVVQGYLFARPMPFSDLLDWRAPTLEQIRRRA